VIIDGGSRRWSNRAVKVRWLPLLLAGCGFRIGAGATIEDDAPRDAATDGSIDSSIDASIDAPVDAPTLPFCNSLDPNLRGCYRFEGNLDDGSMYANGGSGGGAYTSTDSHIGRSLIAASSTITVPFDASLSTSEFTLQVWIRPTIYPATSVARMGLLDNNQYRLMVHFGGVVRCAINAGVQDLYTTTAVPLATWTRVTCIYDRATLKIYFNGIEQASANHNIGLDGLSTGTTIGRQEPSGDPFVGLIDDVRIFSAPVAP